MYKLLIADDEPLEREALRFFVENSNLDISGIIECANGTEALAAALEKSPDIMILDIKMPGLSGHEVLEQIRAANRECKIILSTAYSYFNYAVKALQLGAFEFLVKPVQKDLIVRTINKAIDQLDEERMERQERERLRNTAHVMERRILGNLLMGEVDEEALWYLASKNIASDAGGFCFFARISPDMCEVTKDMEKQLREGLKQAGFQFVLAASGASLCFLVFSRYKEAGDSIIETVETLLEDVFLEGGFNYTLGKTEWFSSPEEVEHAHSLVRTSMGDVKMSEYSAVPPEQTAQSETAPKEEAYKNMPAEVGMLLAYIRDNFSDKLTLDSLSKEVGFSKFYISRLFKQHVGVTIMDYLIGVRMDKAKDLLSKSDQSIKQISYTIGYSDPNYFTWSFKKYVGISPVKYRYYQSGVED